ncbi:MAG: TIR domain-containing protein [Phascolarctobacterium sp.]|nr:TIR domain-containing protein [Phascolarctobacterium sp.]
MFSRNKTYHIFISHAWKYSGHYDKIEEWIYTSDITIANYSVSKEKGFERLPRKTLESKIREQIEQANVVIILAGMYATYSDWIEYEFNTALAMRKPILGVYPWGQEKTPTFITEQATMMVHWNRNSVIGALKYLLE